MRKRPLLFSLALLGLACSDDTGGNDIDTDAADETAGSGGSGLSSEPIRTVPSDWKA